jgi:proliferating cell nuclear antigen
MLVKLENPLFFVKAIELISELVLEVRIKINDMGFSIIAIDPANVAMVGFRVPKQSFSIYETGEEILGVNLDDLKKILKRCGTRSSLIMEKNENNLEIRIEDRIKRKFNLNLIEVESEDKEMPSGFEFSSKVELDSQDLIDSIEDCSVISDACSFIIENGNFIIEAKELNSARSEFSPDEANIQAEDCHARYSLEYLQKFVKGSKLFPKTTLNFSANHPLKMDLEDENLSLNFILAPRIETE